MLDGQETVEIASGELRWKGARQRAGRRGNRGNSLRRALLGGSETACWTGQNRGNSLRRASLEGARQHAGRIGNLENSLRQSCWHGFFQDKCHRCDWPEKIVDPRLVKWSQDRSNGLQRLKNGTCTEKLLHKKSLYTETLTHRRVYRDTEES